MDLQTWYAGLAPRERRVLAWGGAAAAALLVVALLWRLAVAVSAAEARVERKQADLAWIESVTPRLSAMPVQRAGESLAIAVDRGAREAGLGQALAGAEPAGPGALRVRFESAAFDSLAQWLARLQMQRGAAVESASFEPAGEPGRVNATVVLRGA